jgi:DNA topoisomerase 2-associated protein PAT1
MAFFGLPERDLDPDEDVAVYTWGEESYDGLGDALQEGGDDLNDETFGTAGPIGTYSLSLTLRPDFPNFRRQRFRLFEPGPSR